MVLDQCNRFFVLIFALLLILSVSVFALPLTNSNNSNNVLSIIQSMNLPFDGNYGPCLQDSLVTSMLTSQPTNGTNVTGGLTGTFPQPNNFTCLPVGLAVMIHNQNITNLNSTEIFNNLQNLTNNSSHMTALIGAVVQLLNQSGVNVTITVSGPYAGSNLTSGNISMNGGRIIQLINLTSHPSPPGSNGGANGGTGSGGGDGGGGSGPNLVTGVGFIRPNGTAHFVLVLDSAYCEPFMQGVYYFNLAEGDYGAQGLKWACNVIYWDPWDNKYHEGMMTSDGQWINIGGQWSKVGDTVRVTAR